MAIMAGASSGATERLKLLDDPVLFRGHLLQKLGGSDAHPGLFPDHSVKDLAPSSVMLLLARMPGQKEGGFSKTRGRGEICIVLNKRSRRVRQAGDLCCPGGAVEPQLDHWLAKVLLLPGSPLWMWPHWARFRRQSPQESRLLALLLATSLRESWEEMRLNPLGLRFLGFMKPQRLRLYRRVIYPMVGWAYLQKRFVPSWEVESVVRVPLSSLLEMNHYARFRLYIPPEFKERFPEESQDYPCFIHENGNDTELLWGATYWIVTRFIERIFDFKPPESGELPLVPGVLDEGYIYGRCACGRMRSGNCG
jgi:hypothetical protein